MSAATALGVRDLRVRRSSRRSVFELRVPSLDLRAGEVLAVLGPNGAGKSTLLRALAGLEDGARGRIEHNARAPVTMVFQRPIAFAGSVEHNLRASLLGARLSRDERTRRIREALERFGIARLAGRRAATLSGGELRRLALARAFALRPGVLLLDEPFDDLDAAGQEELSLDLRRAIDETRVAVAVVSHDLRRTLLLADRIAVLIGGEIVQCGPREHVLMRPLSPAVARLVGMSNLLPGVVVDPDAEGVPCVEVGEGARLPVPGAPAAGASVWIGIRPESLALDAGSRDGVSLGKGRVRSIVSDGVAATATVAWHDQALRVHLLAGSGRARTLAPGDAVALSLRPEDLHCMERSGDALR